MDTLHKFSYDFSAASSALVPSTGPVLCRDEMEEWSASEVKKHNLKSMQTLSRFYLFNIIRIELNIHTIYFRPIYSRKLSKNTEKTSPISDPTFCPGKL